MTLLFAFLRDSFTRREMEQVRRHLPRRTGKPARRLAFARSQKKGGLVAPGATAAAVAAPVAAAVVAAMQRWLIAAVVGIAAIRTGRNAAQRRLTLFVVRDAALVLNAGQACLHVVEFRRRHQILVLRRQKRGYLFFGVLDAIRCLRMIFEDARNGAGLRLLEVLNLFKESHEGLRIVPGA